jgi:hypothetical protein
LPLPLDGSKVYVTLKIYDLAGNLVNYSDKADVMDDLQKQNYDITKLQASQFTLKFLWSGTSKNGMKLAPGVYKAIITVDYTNNSLYKDARIVKMVGVRK